RQLRECGAERIDDAHKVDIERIDERQFCAVRAEWGNAGIRHNDVQGTQLVDRTTDRGLHRGPITDIPANCYGAAVKLLDLPGGLIEVLDGRERVLVGRDVLAKVDQHNIGAFPGQMDGVALALTAPGTGDQSDLA